MPIRDARSLAGRDDLEQLLQPVGGMRCRQWDRPGLLALGGLAKRRRGTEQLPAPELDQLRRIILNTSADQLLAIPRPDSHRQVEHSFQDAHAHHDLATERLLDAADHQFGASSITLAEVLVAPIRAGRLADARLTLRALGVTELSLPANAAERLAALRVATALKLPDCCVLLAAEDAQGMVLTLDGRLAREVARLRLGS